MAIIYYLGVSGAFPTGWAQIGINAIPVASQPPGSADSGAFGQAGAAILSGIVGADFTDVSGLTFQAGSGPWTLTGDHQAASATDATISGVTFSGTDAFGDLYAGPGTSVAGDVSVSDQIFNDGAQTASIALGSQARLTDEGMFPSGVPIDFGSDASGGTFLYGGSAALVLTAENFGASFGSAIDLLDQQDATLSLESGNPGLVEVMQGDLVVASILMNGGVPLDLFSAVDGQGNGQGNGQGDGQGNGEGGSIIADSYATPSVTLNGGVQHLAAVRGTTIQAGGGDDTITALHGDVSVSGSSGRLSFMAGVGPDDAPSTGGTGSDTTGPGPSTVSGGAGSLTVLGGAGGGQFTGGAAGSNLLVSQGGVGVSTSLTGAAAGDRLYGSAQGDDVLVAAGGRETLVGGGGQDSLSGGDASSVFFLGGGSSTVSGGSAGADTIVGGSGSATVLARGGEAIYGSAGGMDVVGSAGAPDSIVGGSGALTVDGRGGNMLVVAGTTTSSIDTGDGASLIFSGAGASTVSGGSGSMEIVLGAGSASVGEGSGTALYDVVRGAAGGVAILSGFRPATDAIRLFGYQPSELQTVETSGSTLLLLDDGTRIQLTGVTDPGASIVF